MVWILFELHILLGDISFTCWSIKQDKYSDVSLSVRFGQKNIVKPPMASGTVHSNLAILLFVYCLLLIIRGVGPCSVV